MQPRVGGQHGRIDAEVDFQLSARGVGNPVGHQDVALPQLGGQGSGETRRDDPLRLVAGQQGSRSRRRGLGAGARFDQHDPATAAASLAGRETGSLVADNPGQPIDEAAGFDSQSEDQSDVADLRLGLRLRGASAPAAPPASRAAPVIASAAAAWARCRAAW